MHQYIDDSVSSYYKLKFIRGFYEKCGKPFTCVEIERPPEEVFNEGGRSEG